MALQSGQTAFTASLDSFLTSLSPSDRASITQAGTSPPCPTAVTDFTSTLNSTSHKRSKELSRRVEPFLRAIHQFSGAVDVMVQGNSIASLVWGGVKIVLTVSFNYVEYAEKLSKMFCQLGSLCPIYERFEALFPKSPELRDAIYRFYSVVVDFCREVVVFIGKSKIKHFGYSLWKNLKFRFEEIERDLGDKKEIITLEITYASEKIEAENMQRMVVYQNQGIQHRLYEIQQWHQTRDWQLKRDDDAARLRWEILLAKVCDYDHVATFLNLKQRRKKDTGNWLFGTLQYTSWHSSLVSCGLWCHGIPGCGKSMLTAGMVDHLVNNLPASSIMCYFFCTFSNQESLRSRTIITSLTKQILTILGRNFPGLEILVQEKFDRACPLDVQECEDFLLDLIKKTGMSIYILVDGIDECKENENFRILSLLKKLSNEKSYIARCFVSCRSEIGTPKPLEEFDVLQMTAERNFSDIRLFLEDEIAARKERGYLEGLTNEFLQHIINTLCSNADALFLLVRYQLEDIFRENDEPSLRRALEQVPKGLDDMFVRILDRIRSEKNAAVARSIFKWLICAKRPLTLDELAEAVSIKGADDFESREKSFSDINLPLDKMKMVQNCGPLVVLNPNDDTVTIAHHIVEEFLLSGGSSVSKGADFFVEKGSADLELGSVCLIYLNFSDFETALVAPRDEHISTEGTAPNLKVPFSAQGFVPLLLQSKSRTGWLWSYLAQTRIDKSRSGSSHHKLSGDSRTTMEATINRQHYSRLPSVPVDEMEPYKSTYHLLEYAAKNWLYHCSKLDKIDGFWLLFQHTFSWAHLPFSHLPWLQEPPRRPRVPESPPNLLPFFWAVRNGCAPIVRLILGDKKAAEAPKYLDFKLDGRYPAEHAAYLGSVEMVQLISEYRPLVFPPAVDQVRGAVDQPEVQTNAGPTIFSIVETALKAGHKSLAWSIYKEAGTPDFPPLNLTCQDELSSLLRESLAAGASTAMYCHILDHCRRAEDIFSHKRSSGKPEISKALKDQFNAHIAFRYSQALVSALRTSNVWAYHNNLKYFIDVHNLQLDMPSNSYTFLRQKGSASLRESPLEAAIIGGLPDIVFEMLNWSTANLKRDRPHAWELACVLAARHGSALVYKALFTGFNMPRPCLHTFQPESLANNVLFTASTGENAEIWEMVWKSTDKEVMITSWGTETHPQHIDQHPYYESLQNAVWAGNLDIIRALLPIVDRIDTGQGVYNETRKWYIIRGASSQTCRYKLAADLRSDLQALAAIRGFKGILKFFFDECQPGNCPKPPRTTNGSLITLDPIEAAAASGFVDMIGVLRKEHHSMFGEPYHLATSRNLLGHAAKGGHLQMVKYLLSEGCNPNKIQHTEPGMDQIDPLVEAARLGHVDIIKTLLAAGAWPYEINPNTLGRTSPEEPSTQPPSPDTRKLFLLWLRT